MITSEYRVDDLRAVSWRLAGWPRRSQAAAEVARVWMA